MAGTNSSGSAPRKSSSGGSKRFGAMIDAAEAELLAHQYTTECRPQFWLQWDDPSAQDHDAWYKVRVSGENPASSAGCKMPAGWCLLEIAADFTVDEAFNLVSYAQLGRLRRLRPSSSPRPANPAPPDTADPAVKS
eukprot:SAG31_NODE_6681_length_1926_cov_1.362343_3_plen_135_part_01